MIQTSAPYSTVNSTKVNSDAIKWTTLRSRIKPITSHQLGPLWQECFSKSMLRLQTTWHPLSAEFGTNFHDKRRSLGGYSLEFVYGGFSCQANVLEPAYFFRWNLLRIALWRIRWGRVLLGADFGRESFLSSSTHKLGYFPYLVTVSGLETENTAVGIRHADHVAPSIRKNVGTNFADKRRLLGRYSSLADWGHSGGGVVTVYFQILPKSSFTSHPIIRGCMAWYTDSIVT
jgi:hypothetical protein